MRLLVCVMDQCSLLLSVMFIYRKSIDLCALLPY